MEEVTWVAPGQDAEDAGDPRASAPADDNHNQLSETSSESSTTSSAACALPGRRAQLGLSLKRSLRGEVLERLPGWYSPARKRLKGSPDISPHHDNPVPRASRTPSPVLPRQDGEDAVSWSVLSSQRRAEKEMVLSSVPPSPAPSSSSTSFVTALSAQLSSPIQPPANGLRCPRASPDVYSQQEALIRFHMMQEGPNPPPSVSAMLMSHGVGTICCQLPRDDEYNAEAYDVPEQADAIEVLVSPRYRESGRLDVEAVADDQRLLALSPNDTKRLRNNRLPASAKCVRMMHVPPPRVHGRLPAICLPPGLTGASRRRAEWRWRIHTMWVTFHNFMMALNRKAIVALLSKLKPPYFILFMGLIQVTVYAISKMLPHRDYLGYYLVWRSSRMAHQPWRLLSYALLHSDWMHLVLNVFVQTVVALVLEKEQGPLRTAGVYVGGVIGGALSTAITSPHINLVGSSAGVYAILTSHLAHIALNFDVTRYIKVRIGAILLCVSSDFFHTLYHALLEGNSAPQIGVSAHCSGAMSGVLLGLALYQTTGSGRFASSCLLKAVRITAIVFYLLPVISTMVWIVCMPYVEKAIGSGGPT